MSSLVNQYLPWYLFAIFLLLNYSDAQGQLDEIDPICACPHSIALITEISLHGEVVVDRMVIGGTSTLVPAGTIFAFDTVFSR